MDDTKKKRVVVGAEGEKKKDHTTLEKKNPHKYRRTLTQIFC